MRNHPNLEGQIIRELNKGDMLIVLDETDDFYAVQPPSDTKAYIFRTFVLDNQIEGNHVNVRLSPDLEAPIMAQLNTGDRVNGSISSINAKWYEIAPPESTRFYVAKEYLENVGEPSLMAALEKRKEEAAQQLQSTEFLSREEMQKPFPEINPEQIIKNYQAIINNYSDFPDYVAKARELLVHLQEDFLNKKIAYLDGKAKEKADYLDNMSSKHPTPASEPFIPVVAALETSEPVSSRMTPWVPQEQALYETWSTNRGGGSVEEFYGEEKGRSVTLSGILEPYKHPIKNRPGDYLLVSKSQNLPIAYLYSTKVDLDPLQGSEVTVEAVERPNNHFAYPAYFVLSIE